MNKRMVRKYVDTAIETIERVDHRAMAADGPVTPTRLEMSDEEMRTIYDSLMLARTEIDGVAIP
jgi:hypothetical protein